MTTSTKALTPRQADVLNYLIDCLNDGRGIPGLRQISQHFGWSSPSAPSPHLQALEHKGYIQQTKFNHSLNHSIEILRRPDGSLYRPAIEALTELLLDIHSSLGPSHAHIKHAIQVAVKIYSPFYERKI